VRVQPGLLEDRIDLADEARLLELGWREVDAHGELASELLLPLDDLGRGRMQNPAPEREDGA